MNESSNVITAPATVGDADKYSEKYFNLSIEIRIEIR